MKRLEYVELAGKKYPLNLSVKATRLLSDKFGGIEKVGDVINAGDIAEALETLAFILWTLIDQGCAYCKLTGEDAPDKLSEADIHVLLSPSDVPRVQGAVMAAMTAGAAREVEAEGETKNGEATQG